MMAAEEGAEQVKTIVEDSGCSVPQVPVNEVNEKQGTGFMERAHIVLQVIT